MAIRSLFTRGFGNGTFGGTIERVVLRGYAAAPLGTGSKTSGTKIKLLSTVFDTVRVLGASSLSIKVEQFNQGRVKFPYTFPVDFTDFDDAPLSTGGRIMFIDTTATTVKLLETGTSTVKILS